MAIVGSGVGGQAYFDPLAYAPVTGARFGTSGFNQLRGPGQHQHGYEYLPHIQDNGTFQDADPRRGNECHATRRTSPTLGANVSNLQLNPDGSVKNLNGFSQITATNPLGRVLDQRYFRFGFRVLF